MKIGIIGYGSMGKMLLWKFSSNSKIAREDLYIANRTREKVLEAEEIAVVCDNRTLASECDIVFVCYNGLVGADDKVILRELLSSIGGVIELPENEVGMGSELVSCMPGFIASIFDVICKSAEGHTEIPKEQIVKMVLNTMSATGDLMLQKDLSFNDVVTRVATKGGITEEGTKVIYDMFPSAADEMFNKTLEKRRMTAEKAAASFEK